jgi:hypothetical protein
MGRDGEAAMQCAALILRAAAAMLAALSLAGCGAGAGGLKKLAAEADYRAAAIDSGAALLRDSSEDEAYATAVEFDVHYIYMAFLELYPKSARRADIKARLGRFRLFKAAGKQVLSDEDLRAMCWPTAGRMMLWRADNSLAGVMTGGSPAYFGNMLILSDTGSIQMISGGFIDTPQGYEFERGARFIYTTKCRAKT